MRPFVLLIDDEEGFRESVQSAFALRGIPLDAVEDWNSGLALFQACAHELVIADYNLPDSKNGLMLLAQAKAHRPATKLMLISGVLSASAIEILNGSKIVDAYYPKTADVTDRLLEAAVEAQERAGQPTDWARVARAYLANTEIDLNAIEEIDGALRAQMGG